MRPSSSMEQVTEQYLIDTTPLSGLLSNRPPLVRLITPWIRAGRAWTSILVYGEAYERIVDLPNFAHHHTRLLDLLTAIRSLPIDEAVMRRYAAIRRSLRRTSNLIGDVDTLIAATAIESELTIVTTDSDFVRVAGLHYLLLDRHTFRAIQRSP